MEEIKFKFNFPKTGCLDFQTIEDFTKNNSENKKKKP